MAGTVFQSSSEVLLITLVLVAKLINLVPSGWASPGVTMLVVIIIEGQSKANSGHGNDEEFHPGDENSNKPVVTSPSLGFDYFKIEGFVAV